MIPTLPEDYFFHLRFKMESVMQNKDGFGCLRVNKFHQKKEDQKRTRCRKVIKTISRGGLTEGKISTPWKKALFGFFYSLLMIQTLNDFNERLFY